MKKETGKITGESLTPNKNNKIIIGIDPGLQNLGVGIIEIDPIITTTIETNKKQQINPKTLIPYVIQHAHQLIQIKQKREITEKLYFIYQTIDQIITHHNPKLIIVEDSFVGINKNSAIKLGLARGAILTAIGKHDIQVIMIPPKQIKMEVAQKGDASKEEIELFFQNYLPNFEKKQKLDTSDALAAAFCGIKHLILETTQITT